MKNLLEILKENNIDVFTNHDAVKIIDKKPSYVKLLLHRLAMQNKIKRIERNLYCTSTAGFYEIASNIIPFSYVSLLSAFAFHGLTTQMPLSIDVISSRQHKDLRIENMKIHFIKLGRERIFGFYRDKNTNAFVAEVEKAIVDSLYLKNPSFGYVSESFENALRKKLIDVEKLKDYAE
ncbi:MAG: hypothetical protein M1594_00705, partial [Candidatus Marsarchaeota archaeon]|nr:hypothetical protein [Candidatus Marsarchaeota archaeon]